jgi:hypothetical protein
MKALMLLVACVPVCAQLIRRCPRGSEQPRRVGRIAINVGADLPQLKAAVLRALNESSTGTA